MKKTISQKLIQSIKIGTERMRKLAPVDRKFLEKSWDIEHAYYSSALEGSRIDKKEFEKLAKKVA